jgi:N-ethylmaleimide reductase
MNANNVATLFTPVDFGPLHLKHRVVMAPLTRSRSEQPDSIPGDLMAEYYEQRASDGGLIIGEATNISLASRGWYGAPGLFSDAQVEGWRKVVARVHVKGGKMFAQLWHTGRASHVSNTGGVDPVSASVNPEYWQASGHLTSTPGGWVNPSPHRALEIPEIKSIVEDYRAAAQRAKDGGFEGVELHAANGYLVDQFLQDNSNHRTDEYGGSVENRTRFLLEVVTALVAIWGARRVAVRIGPGGKWNDMNDSNPDALFGYVAESLNQFDLAYLHVVEPRVRGNIVVGGDDQPAIGAERLRKIFRGKIIAAGGFEPDTAEKIITAGNADAVAFGRHFVSNPDLPRRIRDGLKLTDYDRDTFYTFDSKGYTDYLPYTTE